MDFETFIHMGGYALNVWGAYGLGMIFYGGLLAHALMRHERLRRAGQNKKKS